jgi:hypothetical protein
MATLIRLSAPRATLGSFRSQRRLLLILDGGLVQGAVEEGRDAVASLESVFGAAQGRRLADSIAPLEIPVDGRVYDLILGEFGRKPATKSAVRPGVRATATKPKR